jgi:hypothetical protein
MQVFICNKEHSNSTLNNCHQYNLENNALLCINFARYSRKLIVVFGKSHFISCHEQVDDDLLNL